MLCVVGIGGTLSLFFSSLHQQDSIIPFDRPSFTPSSFPSVLFLHFLTSANKNLIILSLHSSFSPSILPVFLPMFPFFVELGVSFSLSYPPHPTVKLH